MDQSQQDTSNKYSIRGRDLPIATWIPVHTLLDNDFDQKMKDTLLPISLITESYRCLIPESRTPYVQDVKEVVKEDGCPMPESRVPYVQDDKKVVEEDRCAIPESCTPNVHDLKECAEEKVDDYPEFSDIQKQIIRYAMNGHMHALLISKFNITISRNQIIALLCDPFPWSICEIINFYMNLLTERGNLRSSEGYPKVYAMNAFFTQRLCTGGYSSVRRWTKKVDIFVYDIIAVPVHDGNGHWSMAIINLNEKTIKYYDAMGCPNRIVLTALAEYLREESLDKRKVEFDLSGWTKENINPQQNASHGHRYSYSGVYSCMIAEFICRNRPIVFNQEHMNYFRQKMVIEICSGKMLL